MARPGRVHLGSDEEIVQELRRTGATNVEILDNASFVAAFLPVIRADYRLSETYREGPGARLRVPITVLYGDRDTEVDDREAEGWRDVTDGSCEIRVFSGGHFYLDEHRGSVVELLTAQARRASRASVAGWPSMPFKLRSPCRDRSPRSSARW